MIKGLPEYNVSLFHALIHYHIPLFAIEYRSNLTPAPPPPPPPNIKRGEGAIDNRKELFIIRGYVYLCCQICAQ